MPVPSSISDLSQTANSNSPAGSESPNTADDYLRTLSAFIATLRDGKGFTDPVVLASATTTDIGASNALFVQISGTTTITGFGTNYNGPRFLRFEGALTLTHSSSLSLPGSANITTEAGDTCIAIPNSTPNGWNVVQYQRADLPPGAADTATSFSAGAINALTTVTIDSAADFVAIADGSDSGNSKKALLPVASTTVAGIAELATDAETLAGTDTGRTVTPSNLGATRGMVKLEDGSATSVSSLNIVMTSYTAFRNKRLVINSIVPATDNVTLYLRFSTNGGLSYDAGAGNYVYASQLCSTVPGVSNAGGSDTGIPLGTGIGNTAGFFSDGMIDIFNTNQTGINPTTTWTLAAVSSGGVYLSIRGSGRRTAQQDTDAIRLIFDSGNIASVSYTLYGWN